MSPLRELLVTDGGMTLDEFKDAVRRVQRGVIWWPMVVVIQTEGQDENLQRISGEQTSAVRIKRD